MPDMIEQAPSERDEQIFTAWQGGKTLRVLAREFSTSVGEVERSIDRCLPVFSTATQMRAYKREIQKLEDLGSKYHARAMRDDGTPEDAHCYARLNERYCAMQGWSSVNIRLDPYQAQVKEEPSGHEKIFQAIMRLKYGPQWKPGDPGDGTAVFDADGNRIAPPTAPSEDDANSE